MSPELPPRERIAALEARLSTSLEDHTIVAHEATALASAMCGLAESATVSRDKALDERNAARRGEAVALGRVEAAERERDQYAAALRKIVGPSGRHVPECHAAVSCPECIARRALDGES